MCLSPVGALTVRPSKAQFSLYESLFLSCGGGKETSSEWTCRRNTTVHTNQACCENGASCYISNLYEADSGGYWCESAKGEHDGTVNITVTSEFSVWIFFCQRLNSRIGGAEPSPLSGFPVILESPVAPVTEGDSVTLACHLESTSTSPPGITADFYKDGILVWSSSSADVTLHTVSKANEGLYKCNISGQGESLESWLIVRGEISF